jgi:hypothetical protein
MLRERIFQLPYTIGAYARSLSSASPTSLLCGLGHVPYPKCLADKLRHLCNPNCIQETSGPILFPLSKRLTLTYDTSSRSVRRALSNGQAPVGRSYVPYRQVSTGPDSLPSSSLKPGYDDEYYDEVLGPRAGDDPMSAATIYALSSGAGRAGIAVLRISGPNANHIKVRLIAGIWNLQLLQTVSNQLTYGTSMFMPCDNCRIVSHRLKEAHSHTCVSWTFSNRMLNPNL